MKSGKGIKSKLKSNSKLPFLKLSVLDPLSTNRSTSRTPYLLESYEKSIYASKDSNIDDTLSNRTLRLRIQGQLRTIRALEAQLNDTSNALQIKDMEINEMKRRLNGIDRKENHNHRHRDDQRQVIGRTDESISKLKVK